MGRIADDAATHVIRKGPPCTVGLFLAQMDAEDRVDVEGLFADGTLTSVIRSQVQKYYEHVPAADTLNRHRNSVCKCPHG